MVRGGGDSAALGGVAGGEGKASLSRHRSGDHSDASSRSRDVLAR